MRHYLNRIRQDGITAIAKRRYAHYKNALRINNRWIGRAIELTGNRIYLDGLWFSLDSPAIDTGQRCTIAFAGHEGPERRFLCYIPHDLPLVEFGGAIGVTSCLTNRRLRDPSKHIVFEPNPVARALLEKNRRINRCKFEIRDGALGYHADTVTFGVHENLFMCKLSELGSFEQTITVPTSTVASVLDSQGWPQCSLITDIEGAETLLIENELGVLRERCPFLMLEIHPNVIGHERAGEIVQLLESAGFQVIENIDRNWAFQFRGSQEPGRSG